MIKTYSNTQLENLRASGAILSACLAHLESCAHAGVSTLELDKIAEKFITDRGGEPAFKNVDNFGFTICASVNNESIHGKPRADKILQNGDIISIDCGVKFPADKTGMCTDAARTVGVGEISENARELIKVTEQCFHVAVDGLRAGQRVAVIGEKIQNYIDALVKRGKKYGIVDTYFGHGIGKEVHEEPLVPNFDVSRDPKRRPRIMDIGNVRLLENSIICIEPMINAGTADLVTSRDGWTMVTADGSLAAHFENTLIITGDGVEIVTG